MRRVSLAGLILAAALALAPGAAAGPSEDYTAIRADWREDGRITACRFSEAQLSNARAIADANPDDAYTDFPAQIDRELARIRAGNCAPRDTSPLAGVRIVRVGGRGGPAREYVRISNRGARAVRLGGATLRNRRGTRLRLPNVRLVRRDSLTVRIGCRRARRASHVPTRYLCRRRALFADRGDVARIVDRSGVVVSQRGFGRYRNTAAF